MAELADAEPAPALALVPVTEADRWSLLEDSRYTPAARAATPMPPSANAQEGTLRGRAGFSIFDLLSGLPVAGLLLPTLAGAAARGTPSICGPSGSAVAVAVAAGTGGVAVAEIGAWGMPSTGSLPGSPAADESSPSTSASALLADAAEGSTNWLSCRRRSSLRSAPTSGAAAAHHGCDLIWLSV